MALRRQWARVGQAVAVRLAVAVKLAVAVGLAFAMGLGGLGGGAAGAGAASPAAVPARAAAIAAASSDPPGCTSSTFVSPLLAPFVPIPDAVGPTQPGVVTETVSTNFLAPVVYTTHISVTVNITHPFSGDLEIYLISPHGTRVTLARHNGTSADDIYNPAVFDDQAGLTHPPGPVTMAPFVSGTGVGLVNPQEPLSAFNGENPNGAWKLEVRDTAHADTGRLLRWQLEITALTSIPTEIHEISSVSNTPLPIPDGSGQADLELGLNTGAAALGGITLTTVITHPRTSDLVLELVSDSGITLTLSNRNPLPAASGNVFRGTTWYDQAGAVNPPGPVTDNDYISGTVETPLAPQEAFAELNGPDHNDFYHLIVRDVVAGQAGTLGPVTLTYVGLTCLPNLEAALLPAPFNPRLGNLMVVNDEVINRGAAASDVLLKTSVDGPFAFQSASGAGWSCTSLPVGTLSPALDCVRSLLPPGVTTVSLTLRTPLVPQTGRFTMTVSSSQPDLYPPDNSESLSFDTDAHSGNGNPWDVSDQLNPSFTFPPDAGIIRIGGQGEFFNFGGIRVRTLSLAGAVLSDSAPGNLQLVFSPGQRWQGQATVGVGGVGVRRDMAAPAGADWLRYVDHFTNNSGVATQVVVDWGGRLASEDQTKLAATSDGDLTLEPVDRWAVLFEQDQPNGPAVRPPLGLAFRSAADTTYQGPYIFTSNPLTQTVWPSLGNGDLGQVFRFTLQPAQTRALAYFVVRGLAEGVPGPEDCDFYGGCVTPAAGSQVAQIKSTTAALAATPYFCDLSAAERALIINWPGLVEHCTFLPSLLR